MTALLDHHDIHAAAEAGDHAAFIAAATHEFRVAGDELKILDGALNDEVDLAEAIGDLGVELGVVMEQLDDLDHEWEHALPGDPTSGGDIARTRVLVRVRRDLLARQIADLASILPASARALRALVETQPDTGDPR